MAETGYLLSRDNFQRLRRMIRDYEGSPRSRPRWRRKKPTFHPASATKLYQVVYGMRLRAGTAADDKAIADLFEPVVLCVHLGDTSMEAVRNLRHADVKKIGEILEASDVILENGVVSQEILDELEGNPKITAITEEQLGDERSVYALRCRFAQGYFGSGSIVVGNDSEVWYGVGNQVRAATIDARIDDSENPGLYVAKLKPNKAAEIDGTAKEEDLIDDLIVVRDKVSTGFQLGENQIVFCSFNQQAWFDNDTAYAPEHWYETEEHGFLPVFDVEARQGLAVKNGSGEDIPAYGIIRIAGQVAAGDGYVLDGQKPNIYGSQYLHYVNGSEVLSAGDIGQCFHPGPGVTALYDSTSGTPAAGESWGPRSGSWKLVKNTGGFMIVGDVDANAQTVTAVQVPWLRFHGVTAAAILKDNDGDVSILYGTRQGADTGVDMADVWNSFADVSSGMDVECVWEGDIAGAKWILVAAEC